MKPLQVLVCGGDSLVLQRVAQGLGDEGVCVETSTCVIDRLCCPNQEWDLLLVDLDALTSFLRGLLPAVRLQFPNLSIIGISIGSAPDINFLAHDLELDGYLLTFPKPEDIIVRLPRLAANYLCDTSTFKPFANQALPS